VRINLHDSVHIELTKHKKITILDIFVPTMGVEHDHPRFSFTIISKELETLVDQNKWPVRLPNKIGSGAITLSADNSLVFIDIERGHDANERYSCDRNDWPTDIDSLN
jgi:hypothetical protein